MALTYTERLGDGVTTIFSFSFKGVGKGYIRGSDIIVTVDEQTVAYTLQSESTLSITPAPASNAIILIRRVMPYEIPYSTFSRGNNFGQDNMNYSFQQGLYLMHQVLDGYFPDDWSFRGDLDMKGNRITSLGRPIYDDDAVRLIDIQGGSGELTGVSFLDGTSYMLIDNSLPSPVIAGEIFELDMTCKFGASSENRIIVAESTLIGSKSSIQLNSNLTGFIIEDELGNQTFENITTIAIPLNKEISVTIQSKYDGVNYVQRIGYAGAFSAWVNGGIMGAWRKFFGGGEVAEGAKLVIYTLQYNTPTLINTWNFSGQSGVVVSSKHSEYRGVLQSGEWIGVDPDEVGIVLATRAENVIFDPLGTGFGGDIIDVDRALKDIDTNFIRTLAIDPDPDAPDSTILVPYRTWLVDTSVSSRSRSLPANPSDGDEIRVRDDAGYCGTNNVTIGRNGKTIMGLAEDLVISTDWSWVSLKYYTALDDWRVVEGGVGAQVILDPGDYPDPADFPDLEDFPDPADFPNLADYPDPADFPSLEMVYPIGHLLFSTNEENPFTYLQFGTWERRAEGMFLSGVGTKYDDHGVSKTLVAGDNGGEWVHTQTEEELAEHTHVYVTDDNIPIVAAENGVTLVDDTLNGEGSDGGSSAFVWKTAPTGDNVAMNVTTPSFAMYIWERTY